MATATGTASGPTSPTGTATMSERPQGFTPLVTVVDFHHARGPEVERWFGAAEGRDPAVDYDWSLLPFMALSDGAHAASEEFSYFTLLRRGTPAAAAAATAATAGDSAVPNQADTAAATEPATSVFGISCTRQIDASQLLVRPADVTRSTVQKAVVVITDSPQAFGTLRERLSVVTGAWFGQRDFTDVEILKRFQESLADEKRRGLLGGSGGIHEEDRDQYVGLPLRELIREFRWQTLVLFKCCLLQPKMLFFGTRCERLCMVQFALVSLVPGLIRCLQDSADPELNSYARRLRKPTSLRTSDRNSLLAYMGLPLQIFGKGSLFGPYTPLQKLDILADFGTKSYIVGSTNSLLLQQRDRYSDILINLDENTINITSSSLRRALALTAADRRWIDFIVQEVNDTWDESNPSRPKTMGYRGSEEFIRLQFEEYLLSLIASVKYHNCLEAPGNKGRVILPEIAGDPAVDYGLDWVEAWSRTENYRLWNAHTDSELFNIVEPQHPTAGSLTIEDVQRQFAERVQELHLDERFAQGKEVLGRNLAAGREKAASFFNKLYADMEAMRDAQRRRAEEAKANGGGSSGGSLKRTNSGMSSTTVSSNSGGGGVDLAKAQQTMQVVGAKAGAYMSSWATWASEKRKTVGWGGGGGGGSGAASSTPTTSSSGGANISRISLTSGWGAGWGSGAKSRPPSVGSGTGMTERDSLVSSRPTPHSPGLPATTTFASMSSTSHGRPLSTATSSSQISSSSVPEASAAADTGGFRPLTQSSFSEAGSLSLLSAPASPVMSFKEAQRQAQQQQPPPQQDGETDHQKQEKKTESEVEIQKVGNKVVLVLDEPATKTTPETSVPASSEVARTTGSEKTEEAGVPSTLKE